jgi:prepilin-type N-terminal cleavage/methylation domain-containing protein
MARRSHNLGFTLIELILVMLILAICVAMAAPSLGGFTRGRRLPNTAQDFVTTARWCHNQAVSDGITYHLNLDQGGSRWWVTKDDGTGTNFVDINDSMMKTDYTLPEGIVVQTTLKPSATDGLTYISFDPGGRSDVANVHFVSDNNFVDVASDTPLGGYHIVPGGVIP